MKSPCCLRLLLVTLFFVSGPAQAAFVNNDVVAVLALQRGEALGARELLDRGNDEIAAHVTGCVEIRSRPEGWTNDARRSTSMAVETRWPILFHSGECGWPAARVREGLVSVFDGLLTR